MVNSMEILLQTGYRKIMLSSDDMNSLVNKGDNEKGEISSEKSRLCSGTKSENNSWTFSCWLMWRQGKVLNLSIKQCVLICWFFISGRLMVDSRHHFHYLICMNWC